LKVRLYFSGKLQIVENSGGSGSKNFDPGWVGSIFCGSGRVRSGGFEFEKFVLKMSNFSIFCTSGQKKISLGQVRKYPGQRRDGLLFTVGQK